MLCFPKKTNVFSNFLLTFKDLYRNTIITHITLSTIIPINILTTIKQIKHSISIHRLLAQLGGGQFYYWQLPFPCKNAEDTYLYPARGEDNIRLHSQQAE